MRKASRWLCPAPSTKHEVSSIGIPVRFHQLPRQGPVLNNNYIIPSTCDSLMAGRFSFGFWVLVLVGSPIWHGVGGFMFNSSSSLNNNYTRRIFLVLTGACQFGHGVGGFTTNFIHSRSALCLRLCLAHSWLCVGNEKKEEGCGRRRKRGGSGEKAPSVELFGWLAVGSHPDPPGSAPSPSAAGSHPA